MGNVGTIVSDCQLAQWRANPENKGKTARGGLWSWSRHPNYFFEWVNWCGNALVATTAPWGWIAWIVPAGLLFLLFRVTGIPATEAQALRSRLDYGEYRANDERVRATPAASRDAVTVRRRTGDMRRAAALGTVTIALIGAASAQASCIVQTPAEQRAAG